MKKYFSSEGILTKFVDFANLLLVITNIWIIVYTGMVDFLNFKFPPRVNEFFYRPGAAFPEPFEMPLYLILSFFLTVAIWLLAKIYLKKNMIIATPLKYFFFLILTIQFITKLDHFPLANELYPYNLRPHGMIYNIVLALYIGTISLIIVEFTFVAKIFAKKKFIIPVLFICIGFIIAFFTFEPRFPISAHEYKYFYGPIWEVISGKTLFTSIHTDYGFYATLFFALLYKFRLFSFSHLPIYVWIAFIIQYFLSFYLIFKISRSMVFALIGLFSIITINYFCFFVLPITITQYSAMRRLPSVLLLFFLYKFKKIDSRLFSLLAITDFWIVDTGISILMALGLTFLYFTFLRYINLKKFFVSIISLILFQGCVFLVINIVHLLAGYRYINYVDILNSLKEHAVTGLTMIPIESHNFFWLVILIYFASMLYVFYKKGQVEANQLIILSANLSLFNSLYFVGRSHPANILDISIIVLLNFFLLLGDVWKTILSMKLKTILTLLLFFIFIVYPAFERRYSLTELVAQKLRRIEQGQIFTLESDQILQKQFAKDLELISKNLTQKEIIILSRDETFLFFLSGKKNLLDVNPQSGIDTLSEMNFAVKKAISVCPKKIAVDCRIFQKCPLYESYSQKSLFTAPIILNTIEKRCSVQYKPTICNNHLCIAQTE